MVIVEPVESNQYLTTNFVKDRNVLGLTIVGAGELQTYEPPANNNNSQQQQKQQEPRLVLPISYQTQSNEDPQLWRLNGSSRNALIKLWGKDTQNWIGKKVDIALVSNKEYTYISVDAMRTQYSNSTQGMMANQQQQQQVQQQIPPQQQMQQPQQQMQQQ